MSALLQSTIHVVDDDMSVREALEDLILFSGWRPAMYRTAQEFLARPHSTEPGCLLLDINLPGLNGLDLQRLLAGQDHPLPVIFITGYGDIPSTVRAMKAGAVEFLTKPLDTDALLAAIAEAIERSRAALDIADGLEQTGGERSRHQRNNGEGPPRPGHAENAGSHVRGSRIDGQTYARVTRCFNP
jgi:FixJ family two-component response regulator